MSLGHSAHIPAARTVVCAISLLKKYLFVLRIGGSSNCLVLYNSYIYWYSSMRNRDKFFQCSFARLQLSNFKRTSKRAQRLASKMHTPVGIDIIRYPEITLGFRESSITLWSPGTPCKRLVPPAAQLEDLFVTKLPQEV